MNITIKDASFRESIAVFLHKNVNANANEIQCVVSPPGTVLQKAYTLADFSA